MRPSRSTSASSPRRAPPSSCSTIARSVSAPDSASICTARPASKRTVSPSMIRPCVVSGLRRADDPLGALGIGRGEDLLGREVRHVRNPVDRRVSPADPARRRQQPDRQVGPGPFEVDRVEIPFGQTLRHPFQDSASFPPGGLGIVLVQAAHVHHLVPELVERSLRLEVRIDELGPLRGRPGRHAPVDRALVDDRRPFLHARKDVPAEPLRIQVVEEVRLDRTAEGDRRAALLAELQCSLAVPRPERSRARRRPRTARALASDADPSSERRRTSRRACTRSP